MRHPGVAIAAIVVIGRRQCIGPAAAAQRHRRSSATSLFVQSCGVCHLKPLLGAPQFGPALSRDSASGNEDAMRQVIANGTPRMPGFKYTFTEPQIAAIAAYLKTVPPQAAAAPAAAKREGRDAD